MKHFYVCLGYFRGVAADRPPPAAGHSSSVLRLRRRLLWPSHQSGHHVRRRLPQKCRWGQRSKGDQLMGLICLLTCRMMQHLTPIVDGHLGSKCKHPIRKPVISNFLYWSCHWCSLVSLRYHWFLPSLIQIARRYIYRYFLGALWP